MIESNVFFTGNFFNTLTGATSLSINKMNIKCHDGKTKIKITTKGKKFVMNSKKINSFSEQEVQRYLLDQLVALPIESQIYDIEKGNEFLLHFGKKSILVGEKAQHFRVALSETMEEVVLFDLNTLKNEPEMVMAGLFGKTSFYVNSTL